MSTRIELSEGGWAVLRDPAAVPVKLRRPVEKMLIEVGRGQAKAALEAKEVALANAKTGDKIEAGDVVANMDPAILDQFYELNDLLIVARVSEWSFDFPISVDSLGELCQEDYEKLQTVSASNVTSLVPNFGLSKNPAQNTPDSPTSPSGD
jgi:hypothetical protein